MEAIRADHHRRPMKRTNACDASTLQRKENDAYAQARREEKREGTRVSRRKSVSKCDTCALSVVDVVSSDSSIVI